MTNSSTRATWKILIDLFPSNADLIEIHQKFIIMLTKGDEETPYLESTQLEDGMIEECKEASPEKKKSPKYEEEYMLSFVNLDGKMKAMAKIYTHKYGSNDGDTIVWKILSENEQITECPMEAMSKQLRSN